MGLGAGGGGSSCFFTDRYVDARTACAAYRCTVSLNSCPTLTILTSGCCFLLFTVVVLALLLLCFLVVHHWCIKPYQRFSAYSVQQHCLYNITIYVNGFLSYTTQLSDV